MLAAGVRVLAAGSDPWLDEVWSLALTRSVSAPWDVVTSIRDTNNHALNTLWLLWVGESASPYAMRFLSLLFGTGSVALAGVLGARNGSREGLFAMALVGGSYLMVDASSEARGYAPMVFFALLAWVALEAGPLRDGARSGRWAAVFCGSVALGTLFQLSFVIAYGALCAGWVAQRLRGSLGPGEWVRDALKWHAVPLALYTALYVGWVRHVSIGGDALPTAFILERTAMLAVGIEGHALALKVGCAIAGAVLLVGLGIVVRRGIERAAVYGVGIVIAPALVLWWLEPSFLAPRYFGASIVLFLLLAAAVLGALARRGRRGMTLACVLLAFFLATNARTTAPLLHQGRGDFARALEIMDRESPAGPLEIGLRFHFRHRLLLEYFARTQAPNRELRLVAGDAWPRRGPEWLILAARQPGEVLGEHTKGPRGNSYERVASFEGLPGREPRWTLYRAVRGPGVRGPR